MDPGPDDTRSTDEIRQENLEPKMGTWHIVFSCLVVLLVAVVMVVIIINGLIGAIEDCYEYLPTERAGCIE